MSSVSVMMNFWLNLIILLFLSITKPPEVSLKDTSVLIVSMAGLVHKVSGTVYPAEMPSQMHHFAECPCSMPALVCLLSRRAS